MDTQRLCDDFGAFVARDWFREQCRDTLEAYYLYYRHAEQGEAAACPIHATKNPDPSRWYLASPERMSPAMSERQMAAWVSAKLRRLPILNPNF